MDWVEPGGEEMYISNNSPSNLKIKIILFQEGYLKIAVHKVYFIVTSKRPLLLSRSLENMSTVKP